MYREIANRLEEAEMQMWSLASLLYVISEAVKDKPEPESDYDGALSLASDIAQDLKTELRALRKQAFDCMHQSEQTSRKEEQRDETEGDNISGNDSAGHCCVRMYAGLDDDYSDGRVKEDLCRMAEENIQPGVYRRKDGKL